jgi:hypothetical protein
METVQLHLCFRKTNSVEIIWRPRVVTRGAPAGVDDSTRLRAGASVVKGALAPTVLHRERRGETRNRVAYGRSMTEG